MVTRQPADGAGDTSLVGWLEKVAQQVLFTNDALAHVRRYRQWSPWAKEAGGQLFGTISAERILVTTATGPYPHDDRSRYRYRSDPVAAQQAIRFQADSGLLYLGEWHTHAEDSPNASGLDGDAMRLLLANSQLNSDALLMLIVGRKTTVDSLGLWIVMAERVDQWHLEYISDRRPLDGDRLR